MLLGLLGGWPAAIVAQQRLRHKTAKASFQLKFWLTTTANLAAARSRIHDRVESVLASWRGGTP